MAKKIDITDKLELDENPKIVIKGKELEVNADAATVLKIMNLIGDGRNSTPKSMADACELIFPEESKNEIEKMKLSFKDFCTVVECAVQLAVGEEEDEQGEVQTHTMT